MKLVLFRSPSLSPRPGALLPSADENDIVDLIAAFDQETNENAAEFVRLWMKRPGVPEQFRARYRENAATAQPKKETAR